MKNSEKLIRQTMLNVQAMFEQNNGIEPMISKPKFSTCCWEAEREGYDEDWGICGKCFEHCDWEEEDDQPHHLQDLRAKSEA